MNHVSNRIELQKCFIDQNKMGNNVSIIDSMLAGTDSKVLLMAYQVFDIEEKEIAFDNEASENQWNEIEIAKRALSWHRTRQNWNDHVEESIYDNSTNTDSRNE